MAAISKNLVIIGLDVMAKNHSSLLVQHEIETVRIDLLNPSSELPPSSQQTSATGRWPASA